MASEADLAIPDLHKVSRTRCWAASTWWLLFWGACVIAGTLSISLWLRASVRKLRAHESHAQDLRDHLSDHLPNLPHSAGQVPAHAVRVHRRGDERFYFLGLQYGSLSEQFARTHNILLHPYAVVFMVLLFSVVGMAGSSVAWYGIRVTPRQLPDGVRLAGGQAVGRGQHPAAGRHEHRALPQLAGAHHDGDHPAVRAPRDRPTSSASPSASRCASARCASPAASSQDRRHRLRPHENRLQDQGGRPAQPRRHRRLHR